ncbi:endonuclease III [Gammaproteobacteria bacterium]|nr:endonuclease III [Gammaproteobacteria bacterium]
MNLEKRTRICEILASVHHDVIIELDYRTPYQLLVAVVLSAQATDKGVNRATKDLFEQIETPEQMLALEVSELEQYIRSIGLFRSKAKNVMALSKLLVEKHNSEIPQCREALESLPGVGRKTANVVLNVLYQQPLIAVDTHVFRVANRTGLAKGKTPLAVESKLSRLIPKQYLLDLHLWLIHHGRYTCVARKPKCNDCPIRVECEYQKKI